MKTVPHFAYQAVYQYLNRLIDNVQCGTTAKLPSLRHLSGRLKVSVSTVQYAYCLLEKEGRVCSVPKSGYFTLPRVDRHVLHNGGDLLETLYAYSRSPGMLVLSHDAPTVLSSLENPLLMVERELIRHYPRRTNPLFQPFGEIELRTALADRYTNCAAHFWCSEDVYVGADMSAILKMVLSVLALRGGVVLVESPCSWTILRVLQSFNIRVIEMPLDRNSCVDLDWFKTLLSNNTIGLALLPSRVSTLTGLTAVENRRQLADLLNQYGIWVLENDSHGELCFDPSASRLRDWINPQKLMVFSAFEKIIGPEAPYGYLLCKYLGAELQRHFLIRSFRLSPIRQKAIARLYSTGRIDPHITGLKRLLEDRMMMMATLLKEHVGGNLRFNLPAGGAGIWAESVQPVDMRQVFDRLLKQRISIAPGEIFSLQGLHQQNLRISFAFDWTEDIAMALDTLNHALRVERL
ncbi:PLP-dependent aminotransferase family protein [Pseudomonas sp. CCC3.2]|uniref:aminotransferase-like domain-containing protein n=1 Tax=unclassified Pseudomonas TaxID=196821 RepID=UPI002AB4DB5E|nr:MULTISPECIES: PLP-dependent aminotransferase family protein [unclassified Pseudomonas]MDY7560356.1 PLP-dependent aminotransferase family protein [Pseudomonas sp. AB6]MEA9975529.1 PLP-dependent aminotransferase family protein [Pseudomonas sp. RTS4]MEB0178905.1 PLP-dependent aminotransferase family protein [Pseudomonas sp. CCC3.2]MEB0199693.1 PLP-dependent aminotransferase family protein [Pseudomonas sp. 5S4]MEB0211493.1 PLP-dependent aminotransferase family protein [Pseudomonas sp. AB6]